MLIVILSIVGLVLFLELVYRPWADKQDRG